MGVDELAQLKAGDRVRVAASKTPGHQTEGYFARAQWSVPAAQIELLKTGKIKYLEVFVQREDKACPNSGMRYVWNTYLSKA